MATLTDVARSLGVDPSKVWEWATAFSDHLSPDAVSAADDKPQYNEADLRVLAFVAEQVGAGAETEEIADMLHGEGQFEDRFVEFVRLKIPLFRDVPDEIDETWGHGTLIGGMAARHHAQVARSYKVAADELAGLALSSHEPHELDYPVLFLLDGWIAHRLRDFHEIDRRSDMFRYAESPSGGELWVAFHQLRAALDRLVEAFEPEHSAGGRAGRAAPPGS